MPVADDGWYEHGLQYCTECEEYWNPAVDPRACPHERVSQGEIDMMVKKIELYRLLFKQLIEQQVRKVLNGCRQWL